MKNVKYEKPNMKFVDLRMDQAVANGLYAVSGNCMPMAAKNQTNTFYYDHPGNGWVVIITQGDNCSAKAEFYYQVNGTDDVPQAVKDQAIQNAQNALDNDKQAFSGAFVEPQPQWS